ncbi:MAG: ABC transporter permease [Bacteroidota bacterium]
MKEVLAVFYREFILRRTSPLWLFFDLCLPLIYLLLFGVGFNRAFASGIEIGGGVFSYNDFFLAGVLAMSCFGSAINQSFGFFVDRDNGIFYEFLTYPMTRAQFLLGKILFQCVMAIVQCVLTVGAAVLLLHVTVRWEFIPFVFMGVMLGTAGWFFFLATFAFLIRRNDTFNTVINVAYFVLMFLSSLFYPLEKVPSWLRTVSYVNPLTWHTDALRYFTVGIGEAGTVVVEAILFGGFLLVSFWVATKALEKAV